MNTNRRKLCLALAAVPGLGIGPAQAQSWPTAKPLRLVVPFPPGGNSDLIARAIGQQLSAAIGQTVIVDNRAGAGGSLGTGAVAKEPGDGYTLLLGDIATHVINRLALPQLSYDPVRDFVPVARLTSVSLLVVVNPSLGVRSLGEFIARAKAQPGKLTYASGGNGTPSHLAMEMLRARTGIDLVHVPYKGSVPALNDLVAGQVDVMIDGAATGLVKSGRLQLLAVSGERSPAFPTAPTMAEAGVPDYQFTSWHGVFAPRGTPADIVNRLGAELEKIAAQPQLQKQFAELNIKLTAARGQAFTGFVDSQRQSLAKLVQERNIQFES